MFRVRHLFLILTAFALVFTHVADAEAKKKSRKTKKSTTRERVVKQQPTGTSSPRYAALIINPATGEIYHQDNANERRYPASLTKMMTLYLLFEALEDKKISLSDRMSVSALAARQPQTNLSLDAGDRISVETAIKSLVVRSANDVSVVVAEELGGSVENFAKKMTAKARELGMRGTVFKNPNGLPNSGQYTTAADMAKLGIALKRDFPRYYRYFSTLQFSHNGVTYYTHNRVLLRYAGADGIKTGYIGSSGFNLVSSVTRGGRPLVGVVLGGQSGAWRDNRMIELLDNAYEVVASRGAGRGKRYPNNLPLSTKGGAKGVGIHAALEMEQEEIAKPQHSAQPSQQAQTGQPASYASATTEAEDGGNAGAPTDLVASENTEGASSSPFEVAQQPPVAAVAPLEAPVSAAAKATTSAAKPAAVHTAPASSSKVIELSKPSAPVAPAAPATPFDLVNPPETMVVERPAAASVSASSVAVKPSAAAASAAPLAKPSAEPAQLANPSAAEGDTSWGVQVGAFSSHELAMQAARNAAQLAPKSLAGSNIVIMGPAMSGVPVHRARFENLSQIQAKKTCESLINNNSPCFIFNAAP